MKLADTHTHFYLPDYDNDRDEMVSRAVKSGVCKLLMPNVDLETVQPMLSAAEKYEDICFPMIGLHPTSIKEDFLPQLDEIIRIASQHKFIAVGEIGIDLYWDKTHLAEQIIAFRRQTEYAVSAGLPVVIHSRNSINEIFSVLEEFKGSELTGVFHAYSADHKSARKAVRMGFMLGIGGPLTYKNSMLGSICKEAGIKNIVLETDSPYLTPVPYRGKRNESSYICIINRKLAEIFEMSEEETASMTFENSCRLFNL